MPPKKKPSLPSVLVIGGCGFLGHHIVSQLLSSYTCAAISVLDLRTNQNRFPNVSYHAADITSPAAVRAVFSTLKPSIIIHTASPPTVTDGASSSAQRAAKTLYYAVNVDGTKTLLAEARACPSVYAFVYTSSASVIHDATSDLINASEECPLLFPPRQKEYYAATKAWAETAVLAANSPDFLTLALRPAGIFGEGDTQVTANMITAYKKGQTKFQLGANDNLFDFTYVGNAAHAHILAALALHKTHAAATKPLDTERVDGEAFLITNGEPVYFWDFARMIWAAAGDTTTPAQVWVIEKGLGLALAGAVEWVFWAVGRAPNLTRMKVAYSCMTRYYRIDKARALLGYAPVWGMEEGVRRAVAWFEETEKAKASEMEAVGTGAGEKKMQ